MYVDVGCGRRSWRSWVRFQIWSKQTVAEVVSRVLGSLIPPLHGRGHRYIGTTGSQTCSDGQTLTRFQGITILHRHPSRGSCRSAVLSSAEAPAKAAPKRTLPYRFRPHVWLYFLSRSRTHWLRWDAFCSGVSIQRTAGRQRPYKPVTVALANVWKCRSNPTSAAEAASFLASGSLSTSTAKTVIW